MRYENAADIKGTIARLLVTGKFSRGCLPVLDTAASLLRLPLLGRLPSHRPTAIGEA